MPEEPVKSIGVVYEQGETMEGVPIAYIRDYLGTEQDFYLRLFKNPAFTSTSIFDRLFSFRSHFANREAVLRFLCCVFLPIETLLYRKMYLYAFANYSALVILLSMTKVNFLINFAITTMIYGFLLSLRLNAMYRNFTLNKTRSLIYIDSEANKKVDIVTRKGGTNPLLALAYFTIEKVVIFLMAIDQLNKLLPSG